MMFNTKLYENYARFFFFIDKFRSRLQVQFLELNINVRYGM